MHRQFRKALERARGESRFVVVVVADIRGFSGFSKTRESPETAMYIKRVYVRLIDSYFSGASFFKSTGDGLLLTIPYAEDNLEEVVRNTVATSMRCADEFPGICAADPMVNFETPGALGVGIARGTACCLLSDDLILDFSGHLLNLTARLTDCARPKGVVLDGAIGTALLGGELSAKFKKEEVFLRGVSEERPYAILCQSGVVNVPAELRTPLPEVWKSLSEKLALREWKARGPSICGPSLGR